MILSDMSDNLTTHHADKFQESNDLFFTDRDKYVTIEEPIIETNQESKTSQYFINGNSKFRRSYCKDRFEISLHSNETGVTYEKKLMTDARNPRTRKSSKDHNVKETPVQKLLKIVEQKMLSDSSDTSDNNRMPNIKKRRLNVKEDQGKVKKKRLRSSLILNENPELRLIEKVELKSFTKRKQDPHIPVSKHIARNNKIGNEEICLDDEMKEDDSDDDDDDDWEEVKADDYDVQIIKRPLQGIEVEIEKGYCKGKKSPEDQMMDEIRCTVNRLKVLRQKQCHQVHLLCYLAMGLNYNKICNDPDLQALALSHLPIRFTNLISSTWKLEDLFQFVIWFHKFFTCSKIQDHSCMGLTRNMKLRFEEKKAESIFEHVMMVVITLRMLGFRVRLIHSFQPITSKPSDLLKKSTEISKSCETKRKSLSCVKTTRKEKPSSNKSHKTMSVEDREDLSADGVDGRFDWWSEVYLQEERRWIYVNSHKCVVDDFDDAKKNLRMPFSHVLAWQDGGCVKDLTGRYDRDWLLVTCRKRLDPDWWKSTLSLYKPDQSENDAEEMSIEDDLYKQPLPTNISAYKNHPLYALQRHLLKFECIYPPTSLILGYIRNEAIYSRDCVHLLHSKEKWMVEGRIIRDGEEPCKVVKKRPKNKKNRPMNEESEDLNLFGRWQTELFVPRPAVEGVVPKNEFGNVEIFKPWMLPPGTVYIEDLMPGLNRIAKKLEIDVAPAMLGWEFHRNISAPIRRGWVVCIEHKDILVEAWLEEQRNARKIELEKKQERVLKNWTKLVKFLLVKERLKDRFNQVSNKESK